MCSLACSLALSSTSINWILVRCFRLFYMCLNVSGSRSTLARFLFVFSSSSWFMLFHWLCVLLSCIAHFRSFFLSPSLALTHTMAFKGLHTYFNKQCKLLWDVRYFKEKWEQYASHTHTFTFIHTWATYKFDKCLKSVRLAAIKSCMHIMSEIKLCAPFIVLFDVS